MVASTTELTEAILEFTQRLQRGGVAVEAVILYGSYARGTAYDQSDIDIAIISPDFEGLPINKRQETIADLTLHTDPRITPIGYPTSQYHDPPTHSFLREIIRTGRVVYPRDES